MGANHYKGRLFVTVPRRRLGIPSTLNFISTKSTKGTGPSFRPYPDIQTNELNPSLEPDEHRIISVYRTHVDACNRLWFVDTGLLEYPKNFTQVQRPSIWVYNLENDQFVSRFELPESIVQRGNGLASITVDVNPAHCDNAYAYIPDLSNYRLYVYSFAQDHIWSFAHNFFSFDPTQGDFNIAAQSFQWNDGIFSITLGAPNRDGYKTAYFHPMASTSEFAVSTQVLQNETAASRSNHGDDFKFLGNRGPNTQSTMHQFDPTTGVIFYSQIGLNGVSCWNTAKPFSEQNHALLVSDADRMIYPSDLNVDEDGVIWVMTNTMPLFIYSQLDPNQFNFRVWRQPAADAIRGTVCDMTRRSKGSF